MRKTTSYLILLPTDNPSLTLDDMVANCPVEHEQTALYTGMAGLRFRCRTDDEHAMTIARRIAGGLEFVLRTGYGVHVRDVGSSQ